jgi:hypothetical protein
MATLMGVSKFERFFRVAAGLDVDKDDLKRYELFINAKIIDLLIRGWATAKANARDIVEPFDLPITKGLQESIHIFRKLDEEIALKPILDAIAVHPVVPTYSQSTEEEFPNIAGGLSVALARTFKIIEPGLKNPQTEHWERTFKIFDLLL